jgi:hypothetical protein
MRERSSVRLWAFWGGVIGLVSGYSYLKPGDSVTHVWIELIIQAGGFAALGALLASGKNQIGDWLIMRRHRRARR